MNAAIKAPITASPIESRVRRSLRSGRSMAPVIPEPRAAWFLQASVWSVLDYPFGPYTSQGDQLPQPRAGPAAVELALDPLAGRAAEPLPQLRLGGDPCQGGGERGGIGMPDGQPGRPVDQLADAPGVRRDD